MQDNGFQKIREVLRRYRRYLAVEQIRTALLTALILALMMTGIAVVAESLWYLSPPARTTLLWIIGGTITLLILGTGIWIGVMRTGRIRAYSDDALAQRLGKIFPRISDSITNVLWLHRRSKNYGYSDDLTKMHVRQVAEKAQNLDLKLAISHDIRRFLGKTLLAFAGVWVIIGFAFNGSMLAGANRLFHPATEYPIPKPFTFQIVPGNQQILYTDPVTVSVGVKGEQPEQVLLTASRQDGDETFVLNADSTGFYQHTFDKVKNSFSYRIHAKSPHWWDRWGEITSDSYNIQVISRPQIQSLAMQLTPPKYSGLPTREQEITSTEIVALKGTRIEITAQTNKPVKFARLVFSRQNQSDSMQTDQTTIRHQFTMLQPDEFLVQLTDFEGVTNTNPVKYRITPLADEYPSVEIVQPSGDVDLGDNLVIPLAARLKDDYGFSRLAMEYQIIKPAISEQDSTWKSFDLPLDNNGQTSLDYQHLWELGQRHLSPRDQVRYRLALWDNDVVSGPKAGRSRIQMARFPSLTDMFARNQQQQSKAMEQTEDVQQEIEQIKQQVDKLTMEMRRKEEVTWQQQQQVESMEQSHEEVKKKLENISKQLDKMIQQAEKHNLFSDETMKKYQELQKMFQDLMSPELEQAFKQLQDAMDKLDPKQVRKAMENLQNQEKDFAESIDRALELFKRVKIEQQMEEIVKRIDDLVKQQDDIAKTADSSNASSSELGQNQQRAADEFDIAEKRMEDVANLMEEFPVMPSEQMRQALEQAKSDSIGQQMRQAQQAFQQGQMQSGKQLAQQSKQRLQQLSQQLQNTQQQMQQQTMNEVLSEFRNVLRKVLALSQHQEDLKNRVEPLQGKSPALGQMADEQQNIQVGLQHVVADLVDLSQKTFGVTRDIGKPIGQSASNMQGALQQIADRRPRPAANSQSEAMAGLNETARQLISAMSNLQSQNSSTGFQNYLKQLEQLSKQQQGLNQKSQQMGARGQPSLAQQSAMQQMAAQQMAIRKGLQQMLQEMRQGGGSKPMGDMGKVANDMEDVAKDLRQNKFSRETIERQQKILSRMLDAQKSMRTRDYSKERESEVGEEVARSGPAGLPANYGERRNLLQEDMDQALQEGYSRSYEEIIRNYFEALGESNQEEP